MRRRESVSAPSGVSLGAICCEPCCNFFVLYFFGEEPHQCHQCDKTFSRRWGRPEGGGGSGKGEGYGITLHAKNGKPGFISF